MQFLAILKLIITILPLLIDAVKAIEDAIPGQGKGEMKLAAIRTVVESAYEAADEALPKIESFWPVIQKTISGLVSIFNASGIFKK